MLLAMQPNGVPHPQLPPERSFASTSAAVATKRKAVDFTQLAAASKKRKKVNDTVLSQGDTSAPVVSDQTLLTRPTRSMAPPPSIRGVSSIALPAEDTPVIDKNRTLRAEADKRRKAARSTRGKRASSSMGSGVISQPHPTVSTSVYHKHLPPDIPEALRARHLLVWCASWAAKQSSTSTVNGASLSKSPLLSAVDSKLAKSVQADVLRLLAEGMIDTNVMSRNDNPTSTPGNLAPHDQNIKNLKRKNDFMSGIAQAKDEDGAWTDLIQEYKARNTTVVASLNTQRDQLSRSQDKGKGREVSDWEPWDNELDDKWSEVAANARDSLRANRQRRTSASSIRALSPVSTRLKSLEIKSDTLHEIVNTTSVMADQVHVKLDTIFSNLSETLASRRAQYPVASSSSTVRTMLPGSSALPIQDDITILRGISRIDATRPESQISGSVRRTRQSIASASADVGPSKYTLPSRRPPTPRRTPRKPKES